MSQDKVDLKSLRREYVVGDLNREDISENPYELFGLWINQALEAYADEATAMTLATAGSDGMPSARVVLLKEYDANGFCWFTDYRSEKGQHLLHNPKAELLFYWPDFSRQVRIRGLVEKLPIEESQLYFSQRPIGSRLSAASSCQSHPVDSREVLEKTIEALKLQYPDGNIDCPPNWGGYRLKPQRFEFWQGRPSRLHDRFVYQKTDKQWLIQRLQP